MLKKVNRVSKRSEFGDFKVDGKMVLSSPCFSVIVLDKHDDQLKFGAIISKKISKRAVDRNKIKRRLMEVLGKKLGNFRVGFRILFLIKKAALDTSVEDFGKEIDKLVNKLE